MSRMAYEGVHELIHSAETGSARFPLTDLFNEGWMLRLVLLWFSSHDLPGHVLAFEPRASWFSEAMLPSPFAPRHRGDRRGGARTHSDGVIGHIQVGSTGKVDVALLPDASQLVVTEAKMFSLLSSGTRNAPTYDQAARNVACMAEMLFRVRRTPSQLRSLAFLVVAPEAQIKGSSLAAKLEKDSIERAVRARAASYWPDLDQWVERRLIPTIQAAHIGCLSWEQIIADIRRRDAPTSDSLAAFYERCLQYNSPAGREREPGQGQD